MSLMLVFSAAGQQSPSDRVNFHPFGIGSNFTRGYAETEPLLHSMALQQYVLLCSQVFCYVCVCVCARDTSLLSCVCDTSLLS